MASRDVSPKEIKLAKANNVNLTKFVVAIDALIPVVHLSNPIDNLSLSQLADVYSGKVRKWEEIGGIDKRIAVISRDTSSGTYETWQERVLGKTRVSPGALLQASSGAIVQTVGGNRCALGYIGFGYVNATLKTLSIDGIEPTEENALSGKWPIARELYLFTNGEPKGDAKAYIDYVLSKEGQVLVKSVGFIPLK